MNWSSEAPMTQGKAALFDLDGTLVKTRDEYRYDVLGKVFSELGCLPDRNAIDIFWFGRSHEGDRDQYLAERFGINPALFFEVSKKHETVEIRRQHIEAYADVDVLRRFKEAGYAIGVVTGARAEIAAAELELVDPAHKLVDLLVIADNFTCKRKPDAEGIVRALQILNANPARSFYIGNGDEDIAAAKAANVLDIIVDRKENELQLTPSHLVSSLYELPALLRAREMMSVRSYERFRTKL